MVEAGENVPATLRREFEEEATGLEEGGEVSKNLDSIFANGVEVI